MFRLRIRIVGVATTLLAAASALAQQPSSTTLSPDEVQIRRAVVAFVDQYNNHKANGLAALFAPSARMTFADGSEVNGRDAIQKTFAETFANRPQSTVSVVVDSIRFLTPDVAVEEGTTTLFPDGETLTSSGRYTVLHVKQGGRWLMQAVRVIEEESVSPYGELQALEWLVGDWIDEGRSETIYVTFRWDDNKSFLIEEFQIVSEGEVTLKGMQRIGWDPQSKHIRSWVFDSAGGFGQATWTPVGDKWVVKGHGVGGDGAASSATRTLTRAAKDRVIWTSTDRLMDGEELPDLTVTMVRQPPKAE
jgi:uncharacterized protein (TIGR02246 family)